MSGDGLNTYSANSKKKEMQKISRKRKISDSACEDFSSDQMSKKMPSVASGSRGPESSIHTSDTDGLTVQMLLEKVTTVKKRGLFSEYAAIRMEAPVGTFETSKLKANFAKNRYSDVLCYDHSLVTIPHLGASYINASYADGYKQKDAYICTQGPLPNTFVDFWRMVWNNQSRVIVMTTRTVEKSRIKCGQYWPGDKNTSRKFEEFTVSNDDIILQTDFIETQLMLQNSRDVAVNTSIFFWCDLLASLRSVVCHCFLNNRHPYHFMNKQRKTVCCHIAHSCVSNMGESRVIIHLLFTGWPDHGIPQAPPFLNFLARVRNVQKSLTKQMGSSWSGHPLGPPIVIHCSAGIGRTGTFIAVDICLRQLEDVGTVNIQDTVRKIRSQRAFAVQVPEQYAFCYLAVIEYAHKIGLLTNKKHICLADIE